jgi:hypothetical protein
MEDDKASIVFAQLAGAPSLKDLSLDSEPDWSRQKCGHCMKGQPLIFKLHPYLYQMQSLTALALHDQRVPQENLGFFVHMLHVSTLPDTLRVLTLCSFVKSADKKAIAWSVTAELCEGLSQLTALESLIIPDWITYQADEVAVAPLLRMPCLQSIKALLCHKMSDTYKLPLEELPEGKCTCRTPG